MKKVASVRFENYLFNHKDFPKKSQMAILDSECMDIAREIIEREETYRLANKNHENLLQHYENMRDFFIEIFGNNSRLVEDVNAEIDVLKNGYRNYNQGHSYHDDMLRIRAVFDLYE